MQRDQPAHVVEALSRMAATLSMHPTTRAKIELTHCYTLERRKPELKSELLLGNRDDGSSVSTMWYQIKGGDGQSITVATAQEALSIARMAHPVWGGVTVLCPWGPITWDELTEQVDAEKSPDDSRLSPRENSPKN